MLIRTSIDETGRYLPRRVDPQDAFIALTQLGARAEAIRIEVREPFRAGFDSLLAEARALTSAIEALLPPDGEVPRVVPEPDPALMLVTTREVLSTPRLLNNFIDATVRNFELRIQGAAGGPSSDPDTAAAITLHNALFADGRTFLTLASIHQWAAVKSRFAEPTAAVRDALERLALARVYSRIRSLNDHFGRLLGITEDHFVSQSDVPDTAMSDFLGLATRIVCFANLAWPGTDKASVDARVRLTEPYLGAVRRNAAEYTRRFRAGKANSGAEVLVDPADPAGPAEVEGEGIPV
jgi:hypothetical protein